MSKDNIRKTLTLVDSIDFKEGMSAYQNYHKTLQSIAAHYKIGFVQTVAAFVALSPNNDYIGNLRSLKTVLHGVSHGIHADDITIAAFNHCKYRAYAYASGKKCFLTETKGPKTTAFYFNILKPDLPHYVTIDGHMFNLYINKLQPLTVAARLKVPYNVVAKDFISVARENSILPNQLQAMLWFTWKRIHNIVYDGQLSLLHENADVWKMRIDHKDIPIFPIKGA